MDTNFTKQYLINYDSAILLPYTTIDCILADEEGAVSGVQAIISSILSDNEILIYEKNPEHTGEKYIHQSNLNGENLYMIGMYNDGTNNAFIKMHPITDREDAANQYLGADGAVHTIGNGTQEELKIYQSDLSGLNGNAVNNTWFTGDVLFDSSSCEISLRPALNTEDFYVQNGELRVRTADHVKKAQYLVDLSNEAYNISTKNSNPALIRFRNGFPEVNEDAIKGGNNKFIYLKNGEFNESDVSLGECNENGVQLWHIKNGVFEDISNYKYAFADGGDNQAYTLGISGGKLCINDVDLGANNNHVYLRDGQFIPSNATLSSIYYPSETEITDGGEDEPEQNEQEGEEVEQDILHLSEELASFYPISLNGGKFVNCKPIGDFDTPVYIDKDGKFSICDAIKLSNINRPIYNTVLDSPYFMFISEKDDTNHKYDNKWASINDFVRGILPNATLSGDINDGTASILVARPTSQTKRKTSYVYTHLDENNNTVDTVYTLNNVLASYEDYVNNESYDTESPDYRAELDPNSDPAVYDSALLDTLIHEFEEYIEFSGEKQLSWEQMRASVEVDDGDSELAFYLTGVYAGIYNDETSSNFEEYHDLNNNIAKKLQVATNQIKCSEDNTIKGIYFKNYKLYQTSDERLKTFVSDLDINLDHLATIKKGIFYWKDDKKQKLDIGVTAQSVERYFPQIVDEDNGVKTVSYEKLSVVALAAIDKLNEKIKILEEQIQELKHNV